MQVHGPNEITDHIDVRLNPGGADRPSFAVLEVGHVSIYLYTVDEAVTLANALHKIESLLITAGRDV